MWMSSMNERQALAGARGAVPWLDEELDASD